MGGRYPARALRRLRQNDLWRKLRSSSSHNCRNIGFVTVKASVSSRRYWRMAASVAPIIARATSRSSKSGSNCEHPEPNGAMTAGGSSGPLR